jgi:hypothetical protein
MCIVYGDSVVVVAGVVVVIFETVVVGIMVTVVIVDVIVGVPDKGVLFEEHPKADNTTNAATPSDINLK